MSVKWNSITNLITLLRFISESPQSPDKVRMTGKDAPAVEVKKRGRGRPPKLDANGKSTAVVKIVSDRKRGRPPKVSSAVAESTAAE